MPSLLRLAALFLPLACGTPAWAAPSVCDDPATVSFASFELVRHERAVLDTAPGASTRPETREFELHFARDSGHFAWGLAHHYGILDFSGVDLQTNGHVHTSFVPLHWTVPERGLRVSVAPALSASSNVISHPREWESETPQLLAALVATARASAALTFRYGLCADHQFGEYAVYPTLTATWRFGTRWRVELGFPRSRVAFEASDALRSALTVAPDGNQWHVKDRQLAADSRLVYEAFLLEWRTEWRVRPRFALALALGRQLDNSYEATLVDGRRVALEGEAANRVGVGIRWEF